MAETNTQPSTTQPAPVKTKKPGNSFDVVEVQVQEDGTKKFVNMGTVFIRENGTGGVLYLKEGTAKRELALFGRKRS